MNNAMDAAMHGKMAGNQSKDDHHVLVGVELGTLGNELP